MSQPYGPTARSILRDRALLQIEEAADDAVGRSSCLSSGARTWKNSAAACMFNVVDAKGPQEVAGIVEPLVGLKTKAAQFQDLLSRLESLVSVVRPSAQPRLCGGRDAGSRTARDDRLAHRSLPSGTLQAFESLTSELQLQGMARAAIRKEIADRANMSDGASAFLVQLLNRDVRVAQGSVERTDRVLPDAAGGRVLSRTVGAGCEGMLPLCRQSAHRRHAQRRLYRAGRMRRATAWCRDCCDGVEVTVGPGDKPKALVLLDALEGCRDLGKQGLDCR